MTLSIAILLGLILVALLFFSFEWVSADVVGMGLLLALVVTGLLPPEKAFGGFGSDTVIMILSLLIMTAALVKTGMVDLAGRIILRHASKNPNTLLLMVMVSVAMLSAFISNTAAAAFFIPVVIGIAAKARISPSRLLLPLAFASILVSSVTLISTSTNLVVSGLMTGAGLERIRMFELAPVGLPIAFVGIAYMYFIGRRLIPEQKVGADVIETFGMRSYLTEVLILPDSPLAGKTLAASNLGRELDLNVVRVVRADAPDRYLLPRDRMKLHVGDMLIVEGERAEVLKIKDTVGIEIKPEVTFANPFVKEEDAVVVEAVVVPGSPLVGRSLGGINFRVRFNLQVLGINRHGRNLLQKLSRISLRSGDVLLIQGHKAQVAAANEDRVFSVLGAVEEVRVNRPRAWRAAAIFAGALTLATLDVLPLAVAGFLGAFLVLVTRCVSATEAYREIEWRVVILIACMLGLGAAMIETGAATYLAGLVSGLSSGAHPLWLLGGFFVLTVALTQPMSNQAAAAVIVPIAVATAQQLDLNPRAFAMMVAVAASCSYLTPLEPACLLVYGPGRYRFFDFIRVGLPLTILIFIVALLLVPRVWPLHLAPALP